MSALADLRVRIIAAPMAGGPSTPELVRAVSGVGGLGFLAAGYQTPHALAQQIEACAGVPFGVNVFVPDDDPIPAAVQAFRHRLAPLAEQFGLDELPQPHPDDDHYRAKLDLVLDAGVPVVSFTFGCPDPADVRRIRQRGAAVIVTVTTPDDARQAVAAGVDALCVQGPEAGGHRATFSVAAEPDPTPVLPLVTAVRQETNLPLVAAGAIMTAADVERVLAAGAIAAQCGTALLLATEAGTAATHRAALADPAFAATRVTRAFSGRPARGLVNTWMQEFGDAPASYPAVNQLTSAIRRAAAAAGDAEYTHLWAGEGWRLAQAGPAAGIVAALNPG